jgi:hypothetical protein
MIKKTLRLNAKPDSSLDLTQKRQETQAKAGRIREPPPKTPAEFQDSAQTIPLQTGSSSCVFAVLSHYFETFREDFDQVKTRRNRRRNDFCVRLAGS